MIWGEHSCATHWARLSPIRYIEAWAGHGHCNALCPLLLSPSLNCKIPLSLCKGGFGLGGSQMGGPSSSHWQATWIAPVIESNSLVSSSLASPCTTRPQSLSIRFDRAHASMRNLSHEAEPLQAFNLSETLGD